MQTLTIDARQIIRGQGFDDDYPDGGMSPDYGNLNYFLSKGKNLTPAPDFETMLDIVERKVLASVDIGNNGAINKVLVTDDGGFYTQEGATITRLQTDATGV